MADPLTSLAWLHPDVTAGLMNRAGLHDAVLRLLTHAFYARIRADAELGSLFAAQITEREPHLEKMVAFWSSVALMTGRYHGRPGPAHTPLPIGAAHFDRWLALFRATALEVCSPAGAAHVIGRAERIARSLQIAVLDATRTADAVPRLT